MKISSVIDDDASESETTANNETSDASSVAQRKNPASTIEGDDGPLTWMKQLHGSWLMFGLNGIIVEQTDGVETNDKNPFFRFFE